MKTRTDGADINTVTTMDTAPAEADVSDQAAIGVLVALLIGLPLVTFLVATTGMNWTWAGALGLAGGVTGTVFAVLALFGLVCARWERQYTTAAPEPVSA